MSDEGGLDQPVVNVQLFIELLKGSVIKLSAIVGNDELRQNKLVDDGLPDEAACILLDDPRKRLCLDLLSEVIDYHD